MGDESQQIIDPLRRLLIVVGRCRERSESLLVVVVGAIELIEDGVEDSRLRRADVEVAGQDAERVFSVTGKLVNELVEFVKLIRFDGRVASFAPLQMRRK